VRDHTAGSVDLGGSVEQVGSAPDARARSGCIANPEKGLGIIEYDYVGTVLVRVSSALTPDQAKMYQAALA